MDKIFIIGSTGFAKEVFFLLKKLNIYEIGGFIDIEPNRKTIKIGLKEIPIIDEKIFLLNYKDVNVCIGTGHPKIITKIIKKYKNYNFPNIVHPTFIGDIESILFGVGSSILEKITIGDDNIIGGGSVIINNIDNGSTYVGIPGKKIK
jgi:hypothetical protein